MKSSLSTAPSRVRSRQATLVRQALTCTFFAAFVAVCARVAIPLPFTPIPITLQPLAVMLTGLMLGGPLAFFALLEYLLAGVLGAPVFAGGLPLADPVTMSGLGYLLSYPVAAFAIGKVAEGGRESYTRFLLSGLLGLAIIYLGGNGYLAFWLHTSPLQTLLMGAAPFIALDIVKAAIAAGAARGSGRNHWFVWRAGSLLG